MGALNTAGRSAATHLTCRDLDLYTGSLANRRGSSVASPSSPSPPYHYIDAGLTREQIWGVGKRRDFDCQLALRSPALGATERRLISTIAEPALNRDNVVRTSEEE
jgi:hypothetical protein